VAALPIYSSFLVGATEYLGTQTLEIPSGAVCVVRDIDAVCGTGIGASIWAYDNAGIKFWGVTFAVSDLVFTTASWRGRQVLPGPDFLHITTDSALDFRCSGYLLSGP